MLIAKKEPNESALRRQCTQLDSITAVPYHATPRRRYFDGATDWREGLGNPCRVVGMQQAAVTAGCVHLAG